MKQAPAVVALALSLAACGGDDPSGGVGDRTVELEARFSRFTPGEVIVPVGSRVRFVVRNQDPIAHELIVGDERVHARHEDGTEPHHADKPGEVSVPAGSTAETTYLFDRPGTVVFACHLPGHFAYGMQGVVRVVGQDQKVTSSHTRDQKPGSSASSSAAGGSGAAALGAGRMA